jgi:o-succinylbenzoate synthase
MLKAEFKKHTLIFKRPAGTSRGVLNTKDSWYLFVWDTNNSFVRGIGECSIIPNLSIDDRPDYEDMLEKLCSDINNYESYLNELKNGWPSILFGLETALADLKTGGKKIFYDSDFTKGKDSIYINGLIWMGDEAFMEEQVNEKISTFDCLKMKIGAINFDKELDILKSIRSKDFNKPELRVDANGAFSFDEAKEKLQILSQYNIHSIEQPIKQGNWKDMSELCQITPVPIALDEELIGVNDPKKKELLLDTIKPQYIILKPSLLGGISMCEEWIRLAEERNIGWWITSALEGNIGLNYIAQWTYSLGVSMPQGLGTGSLYTNNIDSPLEVEKGRLWYRNAKWGKL